ncbi:MAG: hypothetical protein NUW09_05610 [Deltaproteobacteria bacterium]|nr:hypothetical protein [Deltaproteobacteria bacterium]
MIELLTGALVVITAFYAWATYKILRVNEKVVEVMHKQAEAISRPYVSITPFLEPDNPIFYLRISNTGKTAAYNLRLTLDKSFYKYGEMSEDANLALCAAFNQTIDSFQPGAELIFSLAQSYKLFNEKTDRSVLPQSLTIIAEYSFADKVVVEKNMVDFRPYLGSDVPQDPYLRKLKDISKAIENVSKNMARKS